MITLGMLSWNTAEVSLEAARALVEEKARLDTLGMPTEVIVIDNGSTDGLTQALLAKEWPLDVVRMSRNEGISYGRNLLLDIARTCYAPKYILLTDGDIEIIPGSVVEMVRYLEAHPQWSGLALDPNWTSSHRAEMTPLLPPIEHAQLVREPLMYVCGYGLFRGSLFPPLRFEADGPFARPGWGHEDDDFYFQLLAAHKSVAYVSGSTYLHRHPRSSWAALEETGVEIEYAFMARKAHLLKKWQTHPQVSGILHLVMAQSFQGGMRATPAH